MTGSGGRATGRRTRRLAGPRDRTPVAHLRPSVAAALLAAIVAILLVAPADATGETSTRTEYREAKRPDEPLTVRVVDWLVSFGGLRTGPWRSLAEEDSEGTADLDRRRWRDWTWSSFVRSGAGRYTNSAKWQAFTTRTTTGAASHTTTAEPASVGPDRVRWPHEGSRRFDDGPSPVLTLSLRAGMRLGGAKARPATRFEPEAVPGVDTN